jgi:hypothetical protein
MLVSCFLPPLRMRHCGRCGALMPQWAAGLNQERHAVAAPTRKLSNHSCASHELRKLRLRRSVRSACAVHAARTFRLAWPPLQALVVVPEQRPTDRGPTDRSASRVYSLVSLSLLSPRTRPPVVEIAIGRPTNGKLELAFLWRSARQGAHTKLDDARWDSRLCLLCVCCVCTVLSGRKDKVGQRHSEPDCCGPV